MAKSPWRSNGDQKPHEVYLKELLQRVSVTSGLNHPFNRKYQILRRECDFSLLNSLKHYMKMHFMAPESCFLGIDGFKHTCYWIRHYCPISNSRKHNLATRSRKINNKFLYPIICFKLRFVETPQPNLKLKEMYQEISTRMIRRKLSIKIKSLIADWVCRAGKMQKKYQVM